MVNDVESILEEIRQRVRKDHGPEIAPVAILPETSKDAGTRSVATADSESLNRLSAHLTTTSRAWDRLPPLYSNRTGSAARFELWFKARLKSISRWFTWEQVNFNSAVHHGLSESLHALTVHHQELALLRAALQRESEGWRDRFEHSDRELAALRGSIESLTDAVRKRDRGLDAFVATVDARAVAMEKTAAELAAVMWKEIEATRAEVSSRLAELAGELRESDQQLRDEQRVCFKQLSLELSETGVAENREQRLIESRLGTLENLLGGHTQSGDKTEGSSRTTAVKG